MIFQQRFNPLVLRMQSIVPQVNMSPEGPLRDSMMIIYNRVVDSVHSRWIIMLYKNRNHM